jgi:hypothetical protein
MCVQALLDLQPPPSLSVVLNMALDSDLYLDTIIAQADVTTSLIVPQHLINIYS